MLTPKLFRLVCFSCVFLAAVAIAAIGCSPSSDNGDGSVAQRSDTADLPEAEPIAVPDGPSPDSEAMASKESVAASSKDGTLRPNPLREGTVPAGAEAKRPFGKGKHSGEPFDPIKVNGPIFEDWSKPRLALVISGRQDGYLEPCGCAGLDRMKGGLGRRHSLFKELRETRGWPVVGLDVGGLVKGFGRQAEMKFQTTVEAMRQMDYDAVGLGKSDLRFPAAELLTVTAGEESPFLSANVGVFDFDPELTRPWRVIEAAGTKLAVTSVLGKTWQQEISTPDIQLAGAKEKLTELIPAMKEGADVLILLAHATMKESTELAKAFPEFDIVVTAGGPPEPPDRPEKIEGTDTLLIEVGEKGENVIVLGFFDGSDQPVRYQRVPLDSRFADSKTMKLLMTNYQDQLKQEGLAGLGIRPVPHSQKEPLGGFVGSEECESCHEEPYDVWKKTGHAKAWDTLKELDPARNFDPECISCHVIGWNPQKYFPYESGFLSEEETPKLIDVGCENCHGPGEKHVKAEMGSDLELQEELQKAVAITKEQAKDSKVHWCLNCHDGDNSPDFVFEDYWLEIEHDEDLDE